MDIDPAVAKKGLRDRVEVFLYNNLGSIVRQNQEILLGPNLRAALIDDINLLAGGYGFPPDLQQILNEFVLTHINQISISPGPTTPTAPLPPTTPITPTTPTTSTATSTTPVRPPG